ncbi:MAG: phosphatase PAP2 family protein [Edaphocola sp.]
MSTTTIARFTGVSHIPVHVRILLAGVICIAYVLLSYILIGFRPEQIFISGLFFLLYTASKKTRNYLLAMLPFIVFWVIFDYMKALPNYKFNRVHIGDLYQLDKHLFGIYHNGNRLTLNEFWSLHRSTLLDVLTGIFYLCWMPVPIAFASYLFFRDRRGALEFCLTFLLTNFVGFIGYYGYPAAPPWYVLYHGLAFNPATPGNVAGLAGFDNFLGLHVFHGLYAKSSNVFAAMPSLHAAYALVSVYYAFKKNVPTAWKVALVAVCAGTWFAAIYTYHHYVTDVLAGICCAICGVLLFQNVLLRQKWFQRFMRKYMLQVL